MGNSHPLDSIMTTSYLLRQAARCFAAIALLLSTAGALAAASGVAQATPTCDDPAHSMVQHRIVARADQGRDALIRFVAINKPVYQLDLLETVAWLDAQRARREACMTTVSLGPTAP
jgi:hypothetical protein